MDRHALLCLRHYLTRLIEDKSTTPDDRAEADAVVAVVDRRLSE